MSWEHVTFEVSDDIATVTLDRPEQRNALSGTMRDDLHQAIAMALGRARVMVITGAGKAFCSGGDVKYMADLRREGDTEKLRQLMESGRRVVELLRELPLPTVAAINGVAAGAGLSLALACDLRIASSEARLGSTFSRVGLHPDWGGSFFLPRLVGTAVACEMIFTGRMLSAEEALRVGLVNRVVETDEFPDRVLDLVRELAAAPPQAVRFAKEAIYDAVGASLDQMLDSEEEVQKACFESEDLPPTPSRCSAATVLAKSTPSKNSTATPRFIRSTKEPARSNASSSPEKSSANREARQRYFSTPGSDPMLCMCTTLDLTPATFLLKADGGHSRGQSPRVGVGRLSEHRPPKHEPFYPSRMSRERPSNFVPTWMESSFP